MNEKEGDSEELKKA